MTESLPEDVTVTWSEIWGLEHSNGVAFASNGWPHPVTYFIGRNGSGKSRTAKVVADRLNAQFLSTDRLAGLMTYSNYGWTSVPDATSLPGLPLGNESRSQLPNIARQGSAVAAMFALKDQPEVWLRVAAFMKNALGRSMELRENEGRLDPYIRVDGIEYSLFRGEGHGLRELTVLLTAVYRDGWQLLVVDEPELHLHPSLARLWLGELEAECIGRNRRAIVVTHQPTLVRPGTAADLGALRLFSPGQRSTTIADHVRAGNEARVTASLVQNPQLVSDLVFSPRPVLVEGTTDVAALKVALPRTVERAAVAQTDLVECGGSGGVALWFEISRSLGLDVRAIADLDACLAPEVQRVMDATPAVLSRYRQDFGTEPPKTSTVVRPLIQAMNNANVATDPKSRAKWLATDVPADTGWSYTRDKLLTIWRDTGLWLHPQGTLEDVLGISVRGSHAAATAAEQPTALDAVAVWCAYALDPHGDVELLLSAAVEKIAHVLMEALRLDPETIFSAPVGATSVTDARLVTVSHLGNQTYRLTVKKPDQFEGYWLDFSRDTPSSQLNLSTPNNPAASPSAASE